MSVQAATSTNGESPSKTAYSPLHQPESSDAPEATLQLANTESDPIEHLEQLSERLAIFDSNNHLRHVLMTSRAATAATLQRMISGHIEPSQAKEIVSIIESVNQSAFHLFEHAKSLSGSTPTKSSLSRPDTPKESEFACFSVSPQKD